MELFLSWSGARSKAMAEAFANWISQVIQAVEPWVSSDIEKGARWGPEIATRLENSKIGILCLTMENLDAPWILFEAGALSKTKDARVGTLLLDIAPSDVQQPLGQFQHTAARDKNDVRSLVQTINSAVERSKEKALNATVLSDVFEMYWPLLSEALETIAAQAPPGQPAQRPEREILQEILEIVRKQEREKEAASEAAKKALHDTLSFYRAADALRGGDAVSDTLAQTWLRESLRKAIGRRVHRVKEKQAKGEIETASEAEPAQEDEGEGKE